MNEVDRARSNAMPLRERVAGVFRCWVALEGAVEFSLLDALQLRVIYLERRVLAVETQLNALRKSGSAATSFDPGADSRR